MDVMQRGKVGFAWLELVWWAGRPAERTSQKDTLKGHHKAHHKGQVKSHNQEPKMIQTSFSHSFIRVCWYNAMPLKSSSTIALHARNKTKPS